MKNIANTNKSKKATSVENFTKKLKGILYTSRDGRNRFISTELAQYLGGKVLNIGGGGFYMKKYLSSNVEYLELDIAGTPDIKINLEKELPIPVKDSTFETVICTDVLEHLDNFHEVFKELLRVSNKYIIISLPNSVKSVTPYFFDLADDKNNNQIRKKQGKYLKFYGLPFEKPDDRHKWFFSYTDAEDFFHFQSKKLNFKIKEEFPEEYYLDDKSDIKRKLFYFFIKKFTNNNIKKNLLSKTYWIVIEK
jgi:SAM-dependent methyltransferase